MVGPLVPGTPSLLLVLNPSASYGCLSGRERPPELMSKIHSVVRPITDLLSAIDNPQPSDPNEPFQSTAAALHEVALELLW